MNLTFRNVVRLILGLFLYALGIALTVQANLGVAPWDAFHQGLSNMIGITFGQASIVVGLIIVFFNIILSEKVGIATILNMFLIGLFIDMIFGSGIIQKSNSIPIGFMMLITGMFVIAIATWLYVGAGLGSGPRDGLMVALTRKTNHTVGLIRSLIELTALILGASLGGQIGIGTAILAFCIGPIVQITFKLLKFNIREVEHTYIVRSKASQ
ncbi:YczE/YyaS/YitT family protein [Anaeromicrobium sediminis]|uniref:YitT family protein n=1 Tax=Anaeromicrobium sediminis TaxID=1478221 RepID=A0A267MKW8_9FIRM|nr:hypothetical protein [Anaeromicrobium sediminis]PAB60176.1 hypothetical protein CCE28_07345 [Anaeromicrobium sediminis]